MLGFRLFDLDFQGLPNSILVTTAAVSLGFMTYFSNSSFHDLVLFPGVIFIVLKLLLELGKHSERSLEMGLLQRAKEPLLW